MQTPARSPAALRVPALPGASRTRRGRAWSSGARAPPASRADAPQTLGGCTRTAAFATPRTDRWIPAAGRRRGRGAEGAVDGPGLRAGARRGEMKGGLRGEGAAPGDRLQPRRAPRPRPAPPRLPRAEAAARAGAALIALGPGTQPARSRDNLAPGGMTIRPNGTTSLPEE